MYHLLLLRPIKGLFSNTKKEVKQIGDDSKSEKLISGGLKFFR